MRNCLLNLAICCAFAACKNSEDKSSLNSMVSGTEKQGCVMSDFDGSYTLDICEGDSGFFPVAVQEVNMKSSNDKLDVTYITAHDNGYWDTGVRKSMRIFFDSKREKQLIKQNGCQVQRDDGFFSRSEASITIDPISKVVTLKTSNSELDRKLKCTLKKIEASN